MLISGDIRYERFTVANLSLEGRTIASTMIQ